MVVGVKAMTAIVIVFLVFAVISIWQPWNLRGRKVEKPMQQKQEMIYDGDPSLPPYQPPVIYLSDYECVGGCSGGAVAWVNKRTGEATRTKPLISPEEYRRQHDAEIRNRYSQPMVHEPEHTIRVLKIPPALPAGSRLALPEGDKSEKINQARRNWDDAVRRDGGK